MPDSRGAAQGTVDIRSKRPAALVSASGLGVRRGGHWLIRNIALDVIPGEVVTVIGPNGGGKTTLLRALLGLVRPSAGAVRRRAGLRVGYVPQVWSLHPDLSVGENLEFTARLHRLPADVFAERRTQLLERTALAPFADRRSGALSGGMKQKLAVANAVLPNPDLLVLDEPTAGVDVVARAELWSMLTEARADTLVVISTSYLDEAEACDRLVYLDAGRVVADDTPEALRRRTPVELYRAWCDDARRAADEARRFPWVQGARATGAAVRVEVDHTRSPGAEEVRAALESLTEAQVHLVEQLPPDMETALLSLAAGA